ncbi:MAG: hypothetical protein PHV34_17630 [Verrucomicrobiae bacterium]|nr:hypothetical protein [Verrucomicrobiae bacterium]
MPSLYGTDWQIPADFQDRLSEPLRALAGDFISAGQRWGVNPALLASISEHETGRGTSRAFRVKENAMGVSDNLGPVDYRRRGGAAATIDHMASRLAMDAIYESARQAGTLESLGSIYAPPGSANDPGNLNPSWATGVKSFYDRLTAPEAQPPDVDALRITQDALGNPKPEQAARVDRLAAANGVDYGTADTYSEEFGAANNRARIAAQLGERDDRGALKHPVLAEVANDPVQMAKMADDVPGMAKIETTVRQLSAWQRALKAINLNEINRAIEAEKSGENAERLQTYGSMALEGAAQAAVAIPKAVTGVVHVLGLDVMESGATVADNPFYQLLDTVEKTPKALLPQNEEKSQEFAGQAVKGLGQLGGIILTGGLSGVAQAIPRAFALASGIAQEAASMYDEARGKGASEQQALVTAGVVGATAGPLDALMPGHLIERLFKGLGGNGTMKFLKNLAIEAGQEATTEGAQSLIENTAAKAIYDEDRDYWDGALESAGVGGVVGAIASAVVSAATGARVRPRGHSPGETKIAKDITQKAGEVAMDIQKAQNTADGMDSLVQAVGETKLAGRDPEAVGGLVGKMIEKAGAPDSFTVPADQLHDVLFQEGLSLEEQEKVFRDFANSVSNEPDPAAAAQKLDLILATGGDVRVDVSRFLSRKDHAELWKKLRDVARFGDGISVAEVEGRKKDLQEFIEKKKQDLAFMRGAPAQHQKLARLRQSLMAQKENSGLGWTAEAADHQLVAAEVMLRRMAQVSGKSLDEILGQIDFQVGKEGLTASVQPQDLSFDPKAMAAMRKEREAQEADLQRRFEEEQKAQTIPSKVKAWGAVGIDEITPKVVETIAGKTESWTWQQAARIVSNGLRIPYETAREIAWDLMGEKSGVAPSEMLRAAAGWVRENGLQDAAKREEQMAAIEAQNEQAAMMADELHSGGELLQAVLRAGGLPTQELAASQKEELTGELKSMGEDAKASLNKKQGKRLFSDSALPLHKLRERLLEKGFPFDTEAEMLDAIQQRVASGKKVWAGGRGEAFQGPIALRLQPAYHGTPHDIEGHFKLEKIGTGEGAQAYGWGLYFAENPKVAEQYRTELSKSLYYDGKPVDDDPRLKINPKDVAIQWVAKNGRDGAIIIADYNIRSSHGLGDVHEKAKEARSWVDKIDPEKIATGGDGNFYTVDIDDAALETFLDWDRPLSEQPEKTRQILLDSGLIKETPESPRNGWYSMDGGKTSSADPSGEEIYRSMVGTGNRGFGQGEQGVSMLLGKLGIKGIRYLDEGSRGRGDPVQQEDGKWRVTDGDFYKDFTNKDEAQKYADSGRTHNLVVFDPSIIKITHKNGKPVGDVLFQTSPSDLEMDRRYSENLEKALSGKNLDSPIPVSNTSPVLRSIGLKERFVVMDQGVVLKAKQKHSVTNEGLRNLPGELRNPIAIFDSPEVPGAKLVVTSLLTSQGLPIVAVIKPDAPLGRILVHDITTLGKRLDGEFKKWMDGNRLEYFDDSRIKNWLQSRGLLDQMPKEGARNYSGKTILTKAEIVKKVGLFPAVPNPPLSKASGDRGEP